MLGLRRSLKLLPAIMEAATQPACSAAWSTVSRTSSASSANRIHSTACQFNLSSMLKKELDIEKSQADGETSALEAVPQGWSLDTKPDDTNMTLSTTVNSEKVSIVVNTMEQEEPFDESEGAGGEGDQEAEPQYTLNFTVDCTKGDKTLRFSMLFLENDTEGPEITHVGLVPKDVPKDDHSNMTKYTGPTFSELDDELQKEFLEYIQSRGIDAELCQYLSRAVYDKEQEDYTRWLSDVAKFVQ